MGNNCKTIPFSLERTLVNDACRIGRKIPVITSLWEVDVTDIRIDIRKFRRTHKSQISLTAYFLKAFVKTVEENKHIHACKSWQNKLCVFEDIDVFFPVELNNKTVESKIIRSANKKSILELEQEILKEKQKTTVSIPLIRKLFLKYYPQFLRDLYYRFIFNRPVYRKDLLGTVFFSSPSFLGDTNASNTKVTSIPIPIHTIAILLGTKYNKVVKINGEFVEREFVAITTQADHSIVDGVELGRFISKFKSNIQNYIKEL